MSVVDSETDITSIRSPIDLQSLERYFSAAQPSTGTTLGPNVSWNFIQTPLIVKQFSFGQSNPTYLITDYTGKQLVLRRKPGPNKSLASKTAHAVEREFFLMAGLKHVDRNAKVPQMYMLCEDESVVGAVFYVMEFIKGRIFHDPAMPSLGETEKRACWKSAVEAVAEIHQMPAEKLIAAIPGLYFHVSKDTNYFQRQVSGLSRVAAKQSEYVDPIPGFEDTCKYLMENCPKMDKLTLIHGDFKIDNMIFHPTEPRVLAMLDWELCTFGHPLFDLANLLQPYSIPERIWANFQSSAVREDPKWVDEVLLLYERTNPEYANGGLKKYFTSGIVFGIFRVSVIIQGIAMRSKLGKASSARAAEVAKSYKPFGQYAADLARGNTANSKARL
ncbi:hypothetical protein BABINDRAFT_159455 [Babjeviella inositovora NRRL Y-12698]|uniref:Aminoglycoside phosphotransferase domain-containing protein n=1 Tax=Babjeviella inositovora NRRL Y-12698 TaxID=984486 RepID=A0A1E3R0S0_9ASCO|nr:uncharacterized protein BABINDRAFT_159455 [Babjeviella inositovora NRRL Y-12698]ODQ82977.1 hypothetical protein BABINDRAFT_159455 [Babjeviella inositovora NRRL Y-12698]